MSAQQQMQQILKVLYAPHKAFKEITQNPKYVGPVVIMVIFVTANLGFGYVLLSKSYLDQTNPPSNERDQWTESTVYWNSNATITLNYNDYINGSYYGNKSIQFSIDNSSKISMRMLTIGSSVNCTGPRGFTLLSLRLNQLEPATRPSNISLYLFSTTYEDNFYNNMTSMFNQTNSWSNITIPVGPASTEWQPNGNPNWSNISGLTLQFTWPTNSNITMLIDGLFFHGIYISALEQASASVFAYPLNAFIQFTIQWVTLGGFLFLLPKLLKANAPWKQLIAAAGFVHITLIVQTILFAVALLLSPNFLYPLEILGGVAGESQAAYMQAFGSISMILWYIERIIYIWAIGLCAFALRSAFTFSWIKSIVISALAYLFSVIVFHFLVYGTILL